MFDLIIKNARIVDGSGGPEFNGDIAITGGLIKQVGEIAGQATETIDAGGHLVTPGWVDIHTHYDGQVTWDGEVGPSSWHGVTTIVIGNCGVGFAPAKPDKHEWLINLMEGVEDIPGTALTEGITWEWETFPEYLDALETLPRTVDVGTHIPHGAVRAYVMGERGADNEAATPEDIVAMADIVREGMKAGALGFSTSRTMLHLSKDGDPVPGTFANKEELLGIGDALSEFKPGIFEMASDMTPLESEFEWMRDLSRDKGVPVTYALLQSPADGEGWRTMLQMTDDAVKDGADVKAQIAIRPTGLVLGWQSTVHPFTWAPSYKAIAELPFKERLKHLRDPEVRARILTEEPVIDRAPGDSDSRMASQKMLLAILTHGYDRMFRLQTGKGLDYEPTPETSVAAMAKNSNRIPAEILYDMLMENEGKGYIYLPLLNYAYFDFDHIYEMLNHPHTVLSLSDGGAHCGVICDAGFPTYLLSHWVRDRSRGKTIALETAVARQAFETAQLYGLNDRGLIAPGMKADINIIDFEKLDLEDPEMVFDLPAGGRRMIQRATGYLYTIKDGQVTFRGGTPTGKRPGGLIRGPQAAPLVAAAE